MQPALRPAPGMDNYHYSQPLTGLYKSSNQSCLKNPQSSLCKSQMQPKLSPRSASVNPPTNPATNPQAIQISDAADMDPMTVQPPTASCANPPEPSPDRFKIFC